MWVGGLVGVWGGGMVGHIGEHVAVKVIDEI